MASPASFDHASVQQFLITTLSNFVSARKVGVVLGENAAYRLNEDNVYQPDVSFLSNNRLQLAGEVYVQGAPDLAVEVISPSSRQYDSFEKRINYARAGVSQIGQRTLCSFIGPSPYRAAGRRRLPTSNKFLTGDQWHRR